MISLRASEAPRAFGYSPATRSTEREEANLELARRYLAAIESGAVGDELAAFYAPDVEQVELPNRLIPTGMQRDLRAILEGAVRGQAVSRGQRYQVERFYATGGTVILEVLWVGTFSVAIGNIPPGGEMRAHFVVILEIEDGRIRRQRNYDCFEPF